METPPGGTSSHRHVLSAAQGWGFIAGGRVVEFGSRFLIALLLAHVLGARDFGLYILAISAVTLVAGVSVLGLDQAVVRYVAILSGRRDRAGIWGTIQIGLGVGAAVGAAMGGALYLGASTIAESFFDQPRLTPLLQVLAIVVPFLVMSEMLAATARGFRRMDYAAFADTVVQSVVRILLLGGLALIGRLDVFSAAIAFGIADVASTITLIILLNRLFPLRTAVQEGGRRDVRPIVGFALPLWLAELVFQFRRNVLTITLGALSTVASVGVFTVASRVSSVGHTLLVALVSAIRPILAQLHDRADRAGLAHLYTTATRWMLTLNLPFFLLIVLYPKILLSLFGEEFRAGAVALLLIGTGELVNAATGICGPIIDMTGHVRIKLANSILRMVVLVAASALLIPVWGVVGAATAGLLSTTVVNAAAILEAWILEGLLPFERRVWKPLTAAVAALVVGFVLRSVFPIGTDLWNAAVQGGIVLGVYAGMILAFGLAPEDRLVLDRSRRKLQRFLRRTPAEPDAAAGVR
jgi:O-antigen/teichoic acid export membrane protein